MDSSYAIWVAGTMLCFLVIESLDVVHGQNTDDASLRALIVEWGDKLPTNWGKTSDPCNPEWEGIQCRNSRIIELKLSSTNLEGNLPADIGGLTELKTLDLSYNKGLSGSLTSSIGELTKLETLILQGCNFDGVIPKELGNLAELYYLALNDNKFIGEMPAEMSKLGKLYWFDITNNKLSGKLPSWLQNLTEAKHFHFGQNQFTGEIPPEIFHPSMTLIHILFEANKLEGGIPDTMYMDKLEVLRLDRNGLTGPVPSITNLTRLNELYLSDNKLTGQLPNLTGLISLKTAYLSNNAFIPAEAPSWLTELTSLTTLAIESGGIQGEFPSKLLENSQLETVKLKNNSFNGSLNLTSTSISSKLKVLDLRENEIDYVIIRQGNTLRFSYSVLGSPFCANGSTEACNDLNNTGKGYSTSFNCGIKPCPNNQNLNPRNCECAYAYTGTMELRAPSFSSFTDAERFRSLERSLWEKLDLLNNSVYVEFQNDDPDRSTYNVIKIQLFPSMKISFDRSEISEIGYKLSNQTYKPPPGFGPFTFRGDPYLYFDGVSEKTSNNNIGIIAGIACGCATLVIIIVASIILVVRKKKREGRMNDRSHNFEGWGEEKTKDSGPAPQLKGAKLFSFDDLRKYTNDFSVINEIGSGGYGKVYKGLLPNGILVAIKRAVSGSMQGGIEFKNEIELLSRVHHKNLVSLIGFCFDKNEQILVYEYIPNGTLRESLLGKTGIVLDWKRRLKVALGSARGLAYLHDNADPSIIHRDVKSSNILLNGNLSAKVADFGLSKLMPDVELGHVSTQVKGTIGYVDPEYYMTQHLTEKSDVYSFGVVMMELITGKPPIERGQYIVRQVRQMLNKDDETRGLKYIIDPLIQNTPHLFGFGNFVDLALRCVEEASDNRPNMCEVVREIELILQNNGSNPATGTSLGSDLGAPKDIPHPYNNSMLHRWGNDSSSAAYDSSAGFQMAYTVEPK